MRRESGSEIRGSVELCSQKFNKRHRTTTSNESKNTGRAAKWDRAGLVGVVGTGNEALQRYRCPFFEAKIHTY